VLHCVAAVCCSSVLQQCVAAVCCSVLQCVAVCCSVYRDTQNVHACKYIHVLRRVFSSQAPLLWCVLFDSVCVRICVHERVCVFVCTCMCIFLCILTNTLYVYTDSAYIYWVYIFCGYIYFV